MPPDAAATLDYARPKAPREASPALVRSLLRGERWLRWTAFTAFMLGLSQYPSMSNAPAMIGVVGGMLLGLLWAGFAFVALLSLLPWLARNWRTAVSRAVVAVAMFGAAYTGLRTGWPLRVNFALSRPFLDAAADRVERGRPPGFCGGFLITGGEVRAPQTVGLYYNPAARLAGLVRHPPSGPIKGLFLGNGPATPLGGRWEAHDDD